ELLPRPRNLLLHEAEATERPGPVGHPGRLAIGEHRPLLGEHLPGRQPRRDLLFVHLPPSSPRGLDRQGSTRLDVSRPSPAIWPGILLPGSFYTEPSNRAHFTESGDEPLIVQITGIDTEARSRPDRFACGAWPSGAPVRYWRRS